VLDGAKPGEWTFRPTEKVGPPARCSVSWSGPS